MSPRPTNREDDATLAYFSLIERERVQGLLVENDAADTLIMHRLVANSRQLDFRLKSCVSIEYAHRLLAQQSFDILYVDYWMRDQTSLAFIHDFSVAKGAPIVLLSGLDEPNIRRLAFRAGVTGFLCKEELSTQAIDAVTLTVLAARPAPMDAPEALGENGASRQAPAARPQ